MKQEMMGWQQHQ